MAQCVEKNKRIVKNTVMLYVRMIFVMLVTLYTSRVVLEALGIVDFGVYNVVGGLASSFVFFSSSLSNSTQRFLNFELGNGNIKKACEIFNISLLIYFVVAIIVFIAAEIIGIWLLDYKLVIPQERMNAACWVFQSVIVSLCITLIGSVFNSVLIARENMKIYAFIGIFEVMTKLLIVYVLLYFGCDKLKLYAILFLGVTISVQLLPAVICLYKYPECRFQYYWSTDLFKRMCIFVGWNSFGTAVWAINEQGLNVLLNIFFGPIVNAAKAIATQVNAAINNFSSNFFTAVRPQIVKSYASGDIRYFIQLIFNSSRFSFYLMWVFCLPILLRGGFMLSLWLKNVPDHTMEFVTWILIYSLINVLTNPFWIAIQAIGKLKCYILIGSLVYLMAFPISYIFFKSGYNPVVAFQVLAIVRFAYLFVTIYIVRNYVNFSMNKYVHSVLFPIIKIVASTSVVMYFVNILFAENFISFIIIILISIISTSLLILMVGLTKSERDFVKRKININL